MNRQEAEELLPWFVAGTLNEDESRAVQAFIDSGEIETQELNEIALFAETVHEQGSLEPAYNPAILQNALAQIGGIAQDEPAEPLIVGEVLGQENISQGFGERLRNFFQWQETPRMAKLALAAQFAAVLALAVFVAGPLGDTSGVIEGAGYETVSGTDTAAALTVAFAVGISEADLRALLLGVNARIVNGPSSLGMYRIAIPVEVNVQEVQKLLNASELTTFVQPVAQ